MIKINFKFLQNRQEALAALIQTILQDRVSHDPFINNTINSEIDVTYWGMQIIDINRVVPPISDSFKERIIQIILEEVEMFFSL